MDKKRYWLKLEKDFLKSKYIKVIKGFPNGHEYILFYLALMLESVETVGHLRFTELVPYDESMLASLTETNIDTVRSALKIFNDLGLIRVLEDGTIFLPDVPRLTGKESESAERVRQFRAKKQQQALQCNSDVTKCNDNKEKEKQEQRTENREEKNTLAQSEESLPAGKEPESVFTLPQLGGKEQQITQEQIDTFVAAYPAVNVMSEIGRMKAWLMSNKKNQKKDVMRFVNAWLAKAQDQAVKPTFSNTPPKPPQHTLGNNSRWEDYFAKEDGKHAANA